MPEDKQQQKIEAAIEELAVRLLAPKATEPKAGVTLITRDGHNTGNAIIVREVRPHPAATEYLRKTNQKAWEIETDFGNRSIFCDREIEEFYTLGVEDVYDRWWNARLEAIKNSSQEI